MRFLADENFPAGAVTALRAAGHDIVWVRETVPGAPDRAVLAQAIDQRRVLLTFDKGFGEIAVASASAAAIGVVLFRVPMPKAGDAGQQLARLLAARDDWAGHFSVIEPGRIRMRPLGADGKGVENERDTGAGA
jgi:Domain of unknown function (DUF5615)